VPVHSRNSSDDALAFIYISSHIYF
jgi:hypothetical protein